MTVYVLLEHEPTSDYPAIVVGVFSTAALRSAARDARAAEIFRNNSSAIIWATERPGGDINDFDDWTHDLIEEDVIIDAATMAAPNTENDKPEEIHHEPAN